MWESISTTVFLYHDATLKVEQKYWQKHRENPNQLKKKNSVHQLPEENEYIYIYIYQNSI